MRPPDRELPSKMKPQKPDRRRRYARVKGPYNQSSVKKRIEAFFLGNIGRIATREQIIEVARDRCEWEEGGKTCQLRDGESDPVGGGTVHLTPDHRTPHAITAAIDPQDPAQWQALCGRHQVLKKNYWDHATGWLNVYAIVQAASEEEKREVYEFLRRYFGAA